MGSKIEVRSPQTNEWNQIGFELTPEMPPASFSDNTDPQVRNIYQISCSPDGEFTYVERSVKGADVEVGSMRVVASEGFERLATLRRDSDPYEFSVQSDNMQSPIQVRASHI